MNELPDKRSQDRVVATWLLICCGLVFAMVVLGGVTRLTGSGLSMAEWRPIMGTLPPLSDAEWQRILTPEQYQVMRCSATEAPFTGKYYKHKA
jgi:heme A synthase